MSTQAMRGPTVRGYHRRKSLDLDLNNMPPCENRDQGESSQLGVQQAQVNQPQSVATATIDIEAIDDDVIESSARAFAEAKNKSRRNAARNVVDVDAEERCRVSNNRKRRREVPNQRSVNCDLLFINLEASNSSTREKPASPPKEPKFNCPICMGPLVEETSTKCGHIFCKTCIKTAISVQTKCPTCRKRVTAKELIRVFLPVTSLE